VAYSNGMTCDVAFHRNSFAHFLAVITLFYICYSAIDIYYCYVTFSCILGLVRSGAVVITENWPVKLKI